MQDVRYGIRLLRRQPSFAAVQCDRRCSSQAAAVAPGGPFAARR
jgi:hypothetical protein